MLSPTTVYQMPTMLLQQGVPFADLETLLSTLACATGLHDLKLDAGMTMQTFGVCGLFGRLTSLVVAPLAGPVLAADLDAAFLGLTTLQGLQLGFERGEAVNCNLVLRGVLIGF